MDDFDKDPVHAIMLDDYGMPIGPQARRPGLIHSGQPMHRYAVSFYAASLGW